MMWRKGMRVHECVRGTGRTEGPTCVDVSFMLFQGVLALERFPAALRFTDEPGVSFTCFLVLLKAAQNGEKSPHERTRRYGHVIWQLHVYLYGFWMMYVTWIQSWSCCGRWSTGGLWSRPMDPVIQNNVGHWQRPKKKSAIRSQICNKMTKNRDVIWQTPRTGGGEPTGAAEPAWWGTSCHSFCTGSPSPLWGASGVDSGGGLPGSPHWESCSRTASRGGPPSLWWALHKRGACNRCNWFLYVCLG